MKSYQVAIDGPSGAGKSTIAKAIAKKLDMVYIDTGAMYRAIGWLALKNNVELDNEEKLAQLTRDAIISLGYDDQNDKQIVFINGINVTDYIRTPEISKASSAVSRFAGVRIELVNLQRALSKEQNVIMDGRDIGTHVLPNADCKIYLTASLEARALRRYEELVEKGEQVTYDEVLEDMRLRDYQDTHRDFSPLQQADDAFVVDTSNLSLEESVEKVTALVQNVLKKDYKND